jgi:hypothetical protein
MIEMTEQQAYAAVFHFLEEFWKRTKSDDVGMLLSSMSILQDGQPADAAITADWQEAVEYALKGGKPAPLILKPGIKGRNKKNRGQKTGGKGYVC